MSNNNDLPRPWGLFGPCDPDQDYAVLIDRDPGETVVTLRSIVPSPREFATVTQDILARQYLGKRIRFAADLRPTDVAQRAALWLRVDGPDRSRALIFGRQLVRGTADWSACSVVLDVPESAERILFGFNLEGVGAISARSLTWGVVDASVPVTASPWSPVLAEPQNLDFMSD